MRDPGSVADQHAVTATGLPFFENFYAGGVRSVRGFRDNTLGPRSEVIGGFTGQPLGGALKTTGSLEMFFPNLFDIQGGAHLGVRGLRQRVRRHRATSTRASCALPTGISLLWRAPVGPISISYAFPLRTKDDDEIERLQFTFGGAF